MEQNEILEQKIAALNKLKGDIAVPKKLIDKVTVKDVLLLIDKSIEHYHSQTTQS